MLWANYTLGVLESNPLHFIQYLFLVLFIFICAKSSFGRLGHGQERDRFTPMIVAALRGIKVVQVACGDFHTGAISDQGRLFTWGKGDDGRLGHDSLENELLPRPVQALSSLKIEYVACGYVTTAAVTSTGDLYTWGGNEKGQLGHGDKDARHTPDLVKALAGQHITQIACATWHTVAITSSFNLFTLFVFNLVT